MNQCEDNHRPNISGGIRSVLSAAGRTIFLPVVGGDNVQCAFCAQDAPCSHAIPFPSACGPLEADTILDQIGPLMSGTVPVAELSIAGPGEALVSPATRIVLRVLGRRYPGIMRSLWTNGLLLSDKVEELAGLGLDAVIISINAFGRDTSGRLYERLTYRGRGYRGGDAGDLMAEKQWLGLSRARDRGMRVVVHSSFIPQVNEQDLAQIARKAGMLGADCMALTCSAGGEYEGQGGPSGALLERKRLELGVYLPQVDILH